MAPEVADADSPHDVVVDHDVAGAIEAEKDTLLAHGADILVLISHLQGLTQDLELIPELADLDITVARRGRGARLAGQPLHPRRGGPHRRRLPVARRRRGRDRTAGGHHGRLVPLRRPAERRRHPQRHADPGRGHHRRGGDQYPSPDDDVTSVGVAYQQALARHIAVELGEVISAADYPEGGEGRLAFVE